MKSGNSLERRKKMGLFDLLFGYHGEGEGDIEQAAVFPEPEEGTAAYNINQAAGFSQEDMLDRRCNWDPEELIR
jgi:hypothetical protein